MDLEITHTKWAVRGQFVIARGARTHAETLIASLRLGEVEGRGECVPYARYGESLESVALAIQEAFSGLKGAENPRAARASLQALLPAGAARNALDCALWDLEAKLTKRSVSDLLGIQVPEPAITAFTLSVAPPEQMADAARAAARHPLLKLKLAGGEDIARVEAVRAARPDARLIVDANEAWSYEALAPALEALAKLGVELVEQPLPAGEDAALEGLSSPIALGADESVHTAEDLPLLKDRYACINVKLDKAGGLTGAHAMAQAAKAEGFAVMLGCMLASSLAMAPASLLMGYADYVDLDGPLLLGEDIAPPLRFDGATVYPASPTLWG